MDRSAQQIRVLVSSIQIYSKLITRDPHSRRTAGSQILEGGGISDVINEAPSRSDQITFLERNLACCNNSM